MDFTQWLAWLFAYILSVTATYTLEWKIYEIHTTEKNKTHFMPTILFHKSYFFLQSTKVGLQKSEY